MTPLDEHELRSALQDIAPLPDPEGTTMSVIQRAARRRRWATAGVTAGAVVLIGLGSVALPPLLTSSRDAVPAVPAPSVSPVRTPSVSPSPVRTPSVSPSPTGTPSVPSSVPPSASVGAGVITVDGFGAFRLGVSASSLRAAGWTDPAADVCTGGWGQTAAFEKAHPATDLGFDATNTLEHLSIGDPTLRTERGVGVGSTLAQVRAAYGSDLAMIQPYSSMASPDELGAASPTIVAGDRFLLFWFDDRDTVQLVVVGLLYEHHGQLIPTLGRPC